MPAPRPVPAPLRCGPFTAEEADAVGITDSQRRGRRYRTLSRGVHEVVQDSSQDAGGSAARITVLAAARPVLTLTPGGALSHASAGIVWSLRLPGRLQGVEPIHVTRVDDGVPPRRRGVVGHHADLAPWETVRVEGVVVTVPVRTLLDLAPALSPDELVACVDGVVCEHRHGLRRGVHPLVPRPELLRRLGRYARRRGVRRLRVAAELSVPGADSVPETRLRLLLREHGIDELTTDHRIVAPDGTEVLPDLAVESARVSIQYEGAHHDRAGQREIDIRRQRRTEAAGWTEVRITHRDLVEDVVTPSGTVPRAVALVRTAIRARGVH
ncbi:hypothetical protein ACH9D2_13540 [Kocuria sp. M4R2S49]|uniref:endonuclease domain-containing protein n=1 Tax=Kocuria rhizosphaericola TaxID=3376284 RepID=UPI0037A7F5B4